jgi:DNA repair photolyase
MNAPVSLFHFPTLLSFLGAKPVPSASDVASAHDLEVAALERQIRRAALRGQPIFLGTADAPYEPVRRLRHPGFNRSPLAALDCSGWALGTSDMAAGSGTSGSGTSGAGILEGLAVSITTRSPLILRDLELLTELDRRHAVTVHVTLPTVDPKLADRLEPGAPDPRARLRAVRQLAEEGIDTRVVCTPILAGENDGESILRPLFEEVREAGANDVTASVAHLRPVVRDRFLATFRLLRLEHGFPQGTPGRG